MIMETNSELGYKILSPVDYRRAIKSPDVYLVDVRTPEEYGSGHIEGASNLDVTQPDFSAESLKDLPKDKTIAVYCKSGKRAGMAAEILSKEGFNVIDLEGGIEAWIAAGFPVTK